MKRFISNKERKWEKKNTLKVFYSNIYNKIVLYTLKTDNKFLKEINKIIYQNISFKIMQVLKYFVLDKLSGLYILQWSLKAYVKELNK